jgi:transcriptional regulator with XRE-family HTH domain
MLDKYAHPVVEPRLPWWHVLCMDNLVRIREARGLTQTQLADAIGVNQATISKIERGVGNPTLDVIQRIAAALRVHPSQLFSRDAKEQRIMAAIENLQSEQAKDAAIVVLEAMSGVPRAHQ